MRTGGWWNTGEQMGACGGFMDIVSKSHMYYLGTPESTTRTRRFMDPAGCVRESNLAQMGMIVKCEALTYRLNKTRIEHKFVGYEEPKKMEIPVSVFFKCVSHHPMYPELDRDGRYKQVTHRIVDKPVIRVIRIESLNHWRIPLCFWTLELTFNRGIVTLW